MIKRYIIWDLDNCLSDDAWRIPAIDWTKENPEERYREYHEHCNQDKPGNLDAFFESRCDGYTPIFFTARPVAVREHTLGWIRINLHVNEPALLMRNNGDNRPSALIKMDMLEWMETDFNISASDIECAYDDHAEVLAMYTSRGISAHELRIHDVCAYKKPYPKLTAADVLQEMATTFRSRNAVYGDNYKMVAKLMAVLFPRGVPSSLVVEDHFHLFELILVKISRYAISGLEHIDSIHDAAVYAAMCETINRSKGN